MKEFKIKKPKQKRSIDKFEAILDASLRVFHEVGYAKSTTARIALEADVNIGSLYDYFSSKEAVFIAYLDRELKSAMKIVADKASLSTLEPLDITREYVSITIDFAMEHKDIINAMISDLPAIIPYLAFAESNQELIKSIQLNFSANEKIRPKRREKGVVFFTVTNIFLGFLLRMVSMPSDEIDRDLVINELTNLIYTYVYGCDC